MSETAGAIVRSEFDGRKLLLLCAALGLTASMNATMVYGLGSFIVPLKSAFGWSRGDVSLASTMLTLGVFLFGPVVGRLGDRFGAAAVGSISLVSYAAMVVVMSLTLQTLPGLWIFYFMIALCGVGSTPIVLLRPIAAGFDKQRGLALGIALTGAGLSGFWVPNVVTAVIANYGWQAGYWAMAAAAMLAAPIVWFGFRPSEKREKLAITDGAPKAGMTFREARNTRAFAMVSLLAFSMALGIGGMVVHLNPLFQDYGASAATAAGLASLIGISGAFSRLLTGISLDRFPARLVTVVVICLGTLGIALIWLGGLRFGLPGVILIGLLLGAELDLLAYLTSRLFGQRAFGAIYGWTYSLFSFGFGLGPLLMGHLHDQFGSYDNALLANVSLLLGSAAVAFGLSGRSEMEGRFDTGHIVPNRPHFEERKSM